MQEPSSWLPFQLPMCLESGEPVSWQCRMRTPLRASGIPEISVQSRYSDVFAEGRGRIPLPDPPPKRDRGVFCGPAVKDLVRGRKERCVP